MPLCPCSVNITGVKTPTAARMDAMQATVVALAALPCACVPDVLRRLSAASANLRDEPLTADADAASAAVFAAALEALPL
jgi:hypothetical protein